MYGNDNPSAESIYTKTHKGEIASHTRPLNLPSLAEIYPDGIPDETAEDKLRTDAYIESQVDPKTGKLTKEHMDNCSGCSLCEI